MIVEDGYNCRADSVDPEGNTQRSEEPRTSVWNAINRGIGDQGSESEPECCKEKPFMWIGKGAGESSWVDDETGAHCKVNSGEKYQIEEEHDFP